MIFLTEKKTSQTNNNNNNGIMLSLLQQAGCSFYMQHNNLICLIRQLIFHC